LIFEGAVDDLKVCSSYALKIPKNLEEGSKTENRYFAKIDLDDPDNPGKRIKTFKRIDC